MASTVGALGEQSVPCVYCRSRIPAVMFSFWSGARRLVSADCPACDRRVTLATATWRRWLEAPVATGPSPNEGTQ